MKKLLLALFVVLGFTFVGCVSPSTKTVCEKPNASLTNTYWKLISVDSKKVTPPAHNKREAHIIFSQNKVKGNSGCNAMVNGSYILENDKLSISKPMAMTRMLCMKSNEREFLQALSSMRFYKIVGEKLFIFDNKHTLLAKFESVYL